MDFSFRLLLRPNENLYNKVIEVGNLKPKAEALLPIEPVL
jgi:hypothetical protein